jgi:hypothetical protein
MFVNLLGITHLLEQTTKNTGAAHPENLHRKTGVCCTTTLSDSCGQGVQHQLDMVLDNENACNPGIKTE